MSPVSPLVLPPSAASLLITRPPSLMSVQFGPRLPLARLKLSDALARIESNGRTLQGGITAMAKEAGLAHRVRAIGRPQWSLMRFADRNGEDSPILKNLFQQEAVKRGVLLLATHNLSAAHDERAIHKTLEVYAEVLKTLASWAEEPDPARFLEGPMTQPVFRVR